jgi:hypothetical protein
MNTILTDTLRFRVARVIAQRNGYRMQRDRLAAAIRHHRSHHPDAQHDADSELWKAYEYVMGRQPGTRRRPHPAP